MTTIAKIVVVLFQLGGPDSLKAVKPFLYNLFCDPDIIDVPGAFLFRKPLARLIASRRSPLVEKLYAGIGGRSPILPQTLLQADALKVLLKEKGVDADVIVAMRYAEPFTESAVRKIMSGKYERIVLLPLYPHFCSATTGSAFNEWNRVIRRSKARFEHVRSVLSYFDHPLYIDSLVEHINVALERASAEDRKKIHLVFSAHGTPMSLVNQGDPYSDQIRKTYELVIAKGRFGLSYSLCFQSKVGPQKWLKPSLTETITDLSKNGTRYMLVIPISFVSEHIETLSEINIEARHLAKSMGITYFDMMPALIDNKKFIACLGDLTLKELKS
jgi:ferrochelatase